MKQKIFQINWSKKVFNWIEAENFLAELKQKKTQIFKPKKIIFFTKTRKIFFFAYHKIYCQIDNNKIYLNACPLFNFYFSSIQYHPNKVSTYIIMSTKYTMKCMCEDYRACQKDWTMPFINKYIWAYKKHIHSSIHDRKFNKKIARK